MAKHKLKIQKLLILQTYHDMDEILTITIEVKRVFGEIKVTPFEHFTTRIFGFSNGPS